MEDDRDVDEDVIEVEGDDVVEETDDEDVEPDSESDEDVVEKTDDEEDEEEDDEDDRVVTFGDEAPEEDLDQPEAPGWVKKVRKVNRKLESENKRLKKQLQERSSEQAPPMEVGEKPTLKSVGYDDKKYEAALTSYYDRKKKVDEFNAQRDQQLAERQRHWQEREQRYVQQRSEHKFRDFSEAEELVANVFDVTQQNVVLQGADDSALVIYALGKNPKKLEELANIKEPVEFAFKIAKLEAQLKVKNKKAPAPEKRVSGASSGGLSGSKDATLSRLRAEAEKTGDYTKVAAYKRKKKNKE